MSAASLDEVYTEAASTITQGLKVEFSNVLLLDAPQEPLILKAGIGWKPGWIGRQVADSNEQTQTYRVLASLEPVITHNFSGDSQFASSELHRSHGVISGVDVLVGGIEKPVGVLGAYSDTPRKFSTDDVCFLQGVANILSAAAERQRANEQLSHMALHDPLTDLPNRLLLTDRLNERVYSSEHCGPSIQPG